MASADILECGVCMERFDREARRPKLLPCGHTLCVGCVCELSRPAGSEYSCPTCRKATRIAPAELADHFLVLNLLDAAQAAPGPSVGPDVSSSMAGVPRFWCLKCGMEAASGCVEEHPVIGLRKHRRDQTAEAATLLARAARVHREVAQHLAALLPAIQAEVDASLRAGEEAQRKLTMLETALSLPDPDWERAAAEAEAARVEQQERVAAAEDALLLLLGSARRCRLAVLDEDGERWQGDVTLDAGRGEVNLDGGRGDDNLDGGCGDVNLDAGRGDDNLDAGRGDDNLNAGRGNVQQALLAVLLALRYVGNLQRVEADGQQQAAVRPREPVGTYEQPAAETIPELNNKPYNASCYGPSDRRDEKAELLQRVRRCGVQRVVDFRCENDPDWALSLLQAAAGRLEEAQVREPRLAHLLALAASPSLRRLDVSGYDGALKQWPPVLTAPARPGGGLQWLQVRGRSGLPRATLRSLLLAHAASLATLWLNVGTPGSEDCPEWPKYCCDLHALLAECGLAALRKLVLLRGWVQHDRPACPSQLRAVRAALPAAEVLCGACDNVAWEDF